jgi:peptidase E
MQAIAEATGKEEPVIAYVGVASGDNWPFYRMISGIIKRACKCQVNRILIAHKKADLDKARNELLAADAVFISGGDVEAGMKVLTEKNLIGFMHDLYVNEKLFFGVSAGSIMLASEWVLWRDPDDDSTAELYPCLGIAPLICDTHAEEDRWEEGAVGYGIPSGACLKVHPDGKVQAVGGKVERFSQVKGKVKKLGPLLP